MILDNKFSRDLVMHTRQQYRDKNVRRQKLSALYQRFGVDEVRFDGKVIGWRVHDTFICYKKAFKTEEDALLILGISQIRTRGKLKAKEVYQCPKCNMWHSTSQGHLVGTYK